MLCTVATWEMVAGGESLTKCAALVVVGCVPAGAVPGDQPGALDQSQARDDAGEPIRWKKARSQLRPLGAIRSFE